MMKEIIEQARTGIAENRFTLTELSKETGIPIHSMQVMLRENWGSRVFRAVDRLKVIEEAMNRLDPPEKTEAA